MHLVGSLGKKGGAIIQLFIYFTEIVLHTLILKSGIGNKLNVLYVHFSRRKTAYTFESDLNFMHYTLTELWRNLETSDGLLLIHVFSFKNHYNSILS